MQGMTKKALAHMRTLSAARPTNDTALWAWVKTVLGLDVPREPVMPGSCAPLAYLSSAFFDRGDVVVWAPRGGGKTMLGAAATVLDLYFKPGVQVRILGGSLEQSSRMYEHVLTLLDRPSLRSLPSGEPTRRRVETNTAGRAAILAQSQRSVRGVRVHKMRCDEVEEFDPRVWEAAQLVTRSGRCGAYWVNGTVEALSTMHRAGGLMGRLTGMSDGEWRMPDVNRHARTEKHPPSHVPPPTSSRVIRWTALDVVERCEPQRDCGTCVLWDDCGGRAKHAAGFVPVDDLVRQWRRSSKATWDAEMMCRRPSTRDVVYQEFDPTRHVGEDFSPSDGAIGFNINLIKSTKVEPYVVGGMDFGWRNPTVMLWARVFGEPERDRHGDAPWGVHVIDEYARTLATLDAHLDAIAAREWGDPAWIGVDPAGGAGNAQTGRSDVQVMRARGWTVRARARPVRDGVEMVRMMLDRGRLRVHPRCTGLIAALQTYHFDADRPRREEPAKDGPDHYCDALRYLVTNLRGGGGEVVTRGYL